MLCRLKISSRSTGGLWCVAVEDISALKMTSPFPATSTATTVTATTATAEFRTPPAPVFHHWRDIEITKLRQEIMTKKNPGTRQGNEFGATLTSYGDTPDDLAQLPSLAVPGSDSDGKDSLAPLICFGQFATFIYSFRHGGKITGVVVAPTAAGSLRMDGVAVGGASHMFPNPHAGGRHYPLDPNFSQLFQRAEKNLIVWYSPSSASLHSHSPLPTPLPFLQPNPLLRLALADHQDPTPPLSDLCGESSGARGLVARGRGLDESPEAPHSTSHSQCSCSWHRNLSGTARHWLRRSEIEHVV
jgi:hypothetical protein